MLRRVPNLAQQAFLITGLKRLEPQRSMIRSREGLHPLDQLPQIGVSAFSEHYWIDVERLSQRQKSSGHISPGCRLLAWNDFRLVPINHAAPPIPLLMLESIHFFGIQGWQSTDDSLPSQIIFFRTVPHVGRHGIVAAINAKLFAASLLDQLARIPETDCQKLHEAGRIDPLPGIILLLRAPLDEAGPTGQRGQL